MTDDIFLGVSLIPLALCSQCPPTKVEMLEPPLVIEYLKLILATCHWSSASEILIFNPVALCYRCPDPILPKFQLHNFLGHVLYFIWEWTSFF